MPVTNLHGDSHGLAQIVHRNQVGAPRDQGLRIQILRVANDNLPLIALDLNYVERRTGGHSQALALSDGKVVDTDVLTDDPAIGGNQLA